MTGEPKGLEGNLGQKPEEKVSKLEQEVRQCREAIYNALMARFGDLYQSSGKENKQPPASLAEDDEPKIRAQKLNSLQTSADIDHYDFGLDLVSIDFYLEPFRKYRMVLEEVVKTLPAVSDRVKEAFIREELKKLIQRYQAETLLSQTEAAKSHHFERTYKEALAKKMEAELKCLREFLRDFKIEAK